jgi:hypothetical protein
MSRVAGAIGTRWAMDDTARALWDERNLTDT